MKQAFFHRSRMSTNPNHDQALLHEQQKLNMELFREWTEQIMNKQTINSENNDNNQDKVTDSVATDLKVNIEHF